MKMVTWRLKKQAFSIFYSQLLLEYDKEITQMLDMQ